MSVENTVSLNDRLQSSPEAFYSPKYDFQELIKHPRVSNHEKILDKAFEYLQTQADKHDLSLLKGLFKFNKGKEDLSTKIQSYLVSNYNFKYYRYTDQKDKSLIEAKKSEITKREACNILQVISIFETGRGVLSKESSKHIEETQELEDYINRHKSTTSLRKMYSLMPDIKKKRIKAIYNDNSRISVRKERMKIMQAKLYFLSYDHKYFTFKKKKGSTDPRNHNAFTALKKVYRKNEFCFQLGEFDIKSANPQIIDRLFGFDRYKTVYSNLMESYGIDKDQAKQKFNATLNNHRLSRNEAERIYKQSGYTAEEARQLSAITSAVKKGSFYRHMAKKETEIINEFIGKAFDKANVIGLHDAIYYNPEFYTVDNPDATDYEFSQEFVSKANLSLGLKMETDKVVLTAPKIDDFVNKVYSGKDDARIVYRGYHFNFYDKDFRVLSANFNINAPVYEQGEKRTPTEIEFIERMKKLYKIIYGLNREKDYKRYFKECVDAITVQQGISFNKAYICTIMEEWDFNPDDSIDYFKERNWTYYGEKLSHYKFQSLYYKELAKAKQQKDNQELKKDILKLKEALKRNQLYCISKTKYKRSNSTNTHQLIREIYSTIGIKLPKKMAQFNEVVKSFADPKGSTYIGSAKDFASDREMARYLNITRQFLQSIKYVLDNKAYIIYQLEKAYANLDNLPTVEKLFAEPIVTTKASVENKKQSPKAAFKNMPYMEALAEWNKQKPEIRALYQRRYANGFLAWKEDHFDKKT